MSVSYELTAEFRDDKGKGASRRLRREGRLPAVLYGGGRQPRAISLEQREVLQRLEYESFYSHILTVNVGGESQAAILKDLQRHPAKNMVMHMDLQRIVAGEKIRMNVPLHFTGEDSAPGVKDEGGVFSRQMSDVEIICLPKDLPEFIEVDVSGLAIGDSVHLSDIKVPDGIEIVDLALGEPQDRSVASVQHVRVVVEDEEETEAAEEGEVPTVGEEEAKEASDEGDDDKKD